MEIWFGSSNKVLGAVCRSVCGQILFWLTGAEGTGVWCLSSLLSIIRTLKQMYLQDQLANFSQNLSVASFGWGKGYMRFQGDYVREVLLMNSCNICF